MTERVSGVGDKVECPDKSTFTGPLQKEVVVSVVEKSDLGELSLSVIVPAFNAAHYLERSLPPLIAMRDQGMIDGVYVVDDCSTDPSSVETARRLGAAVLHMPRNGGPGAARNLAAREVTSDLLWFVDADVVVHEDAVRQIPKAFADPQVHALFGCYDDRPPAPGFASQYKNLMHRYYHARSPREANTFWSGCGVVRRDAFLAVDGFDIVQFKRPSVEDIELGYRMRDAGGKIILDRDFLCTHLKQWSLKEVVMTDVTKRAAPWSRLLLTRPPSEKNLNVSRDEQLRALLAGVWALSFFGVFASPIWPALAFVFVALTLLVVASNLELLVFFVRHRGMAFGLTALAFHQIYYIYSAATFALVTLDHKLRRPQRTVDA